MVVDWTGTNPQVKGAINNTLSFTKAAVLHRRALGAAARHPQQRGRVPRDRGDLPARHDRQRRAAGGLRGARPHRLPHGRLHVRRARHDAARQGQGGRRRRQHRHLDRRLRRRPQAVHLCRLHLRRLGRAALGRRARRQLAHVRQHGLALDRGDRGRAADPDPGLRVRARQGRRRQVSAAACRSGATTASSRTKAMLQVRSDRRDHPPVRPLWRQPGRPSENYLNPDGENRAAAVQAHHDDQAAATCSATCSPAPAAGAIRWSAIRPRCCATCATSCCQPQQGRAPTTAWSSTPQRWTRRRGGDRRSAATRSAGARGWTRGAEGAAARPAAAATRRGVAAWPSPIASASTSAAPSPTSCCSAPDGTVHTKKVSSSVDDYARAIVDGLAELFARDRPRRRRDRGDPPRHHRRLQRHPRAQGRARRPDHHQGLPRRAGDPHAAHAAPLRPRLDQAAAAGRALPARGGRRAHRLPRARSSARSIRPTPSARSTRCWPRRSRRSPSAC